MSCIAIRQALGVTGAIISSSRLSRFDQDPAADWTSRAWRWMDAEHVPDCREGCFGGRFENGCV